MLANLFPDQAIAWLLTYLLHSTLLLGLAWLVARPLGRWSAAAEEAVWKLALVGALFTASLQLAAGFEPAAGRWSLPSNAGPAAIVAEPAVDLAVRDAAPTFRAAPRPEAAPAAPIQETRLPMPSLPALALGLWGLGAFVLLMAYSRSHLLLRRWLTHRPRVVGGTLLSRLRVLSDEAGLGEAVRLSCSSRVPVPLALGVRRSEICVPPRALAGLTDDQQEGMLAHELAHLARRDPLWLVVSHVLACVFFFQPLNWVARRRLREISEMLSDEWAVRRTGRPLSLAGCLAEVAGWSTAGRELPVPGMADRPSHLARRIRRLLDESRRPESPARRIWLGAAMVVLLIGVVAAAPAISAARAESPARAEAALRIASAAQAASVSASDAPQQPDAGEPQEHDVAEEHVAEHHSDDGDDDDDDFDHDYDFDDDDDFEPDFDFDFDFDAGFDAAEIAEHATASVEAALEIVDGQLEALGEIHAFSEQDMERLEREIERANEEIERTLKPRMEQLSRELSENLSRQIPTAEMKQLEEEMRKLGEQMRPSAEEIARIHAHMDEELRKLQADDDATREERRKIAAEARRMARELRPSEEQRQAMEDLRRQHRELRQKFTAEHREEIEKATREMREATRQMREDIQREMDAARKEMHRSREQNRLRLQEERRERERQREIRKDEERQRERERQKEKDKEKPPKVSRQVPEGWAIISGLSLFGESDPGC
jgi:beta-lactamase regulating signal transducer with metallopeptidase domain